MPDLALLARGLVATLEGALQRARELLAAAEALETLHPATSAAATPGMWETTNGQAGCAAAAQEPPATDRTIAAGTAPSAPAGLTAREREVLRLLAAGHRNRRIAAALCLSPRTVQRHVANAYLKIGVHCRAEATVYALHHGLA